MMPQLRGRRPGRPRTVLGRFQEKWKRFSGSQTRQDKDLEPFGDSVKP